MGAALPVAYAAPGPTAEPTRLENRRELVVLLHGLGRGPLSMCRIERDLRAAGYDVRNLSYGSQRADLRTLADNTLSPIFASVSDDTASAPARVHLVTHSMGGILVRQYLHDHGAPATLGRVVMLAPPNAGSELVDHLRAWRLYRALNGPAGSSLGTTPDAAPLVLGPPPTGVEIGVIAGARSLNPLFSALIPGADDGKVSVARTHLAGERDHITLPVTHTWMMWRRPVLDEIRAFLRSGRFERRPAS